ncbi:heme exporter protein CcmD [Moraxella sp. Tifton1]|uniref:Heme exporter protein D n=1 Tax=Moraxella oculi TaxID=2940516 RepID=A0ABW8U8Y9_9GAMM|nr:heme exporter protein CcmD [Moraxella sp. Tifton1]MCL1624184.1 heme exporter protein CcmD [Moraxella sp. Tifton1]
MTLYFSNLSEFIDMQGHGVFVWACYGITFVALIMLISFVLKERKATLKRLQQSNIKQSSRLTNKQRKSLNANGVSG